MLRPSPSPTSHPPPPLPCHSKSQPITHGNVRGPQYEGCSKTPLYGPEEGPVSFCHGHKRAGMFVSRNGIRVVATRDGHGERMRILAYALYCRYNVVLVYRREV